MPIHRFNTKLSFHTTAEVTRERRMVILYRKKGSPEAAWHIVNKHVTLKMYFKVVSTSI